MSLVLLVVAVYSAIMVVIFSLCRGAADADQCACPLADTMPRHTRFDHGDS